jgi:hypothetical protein
MHPGVITEMRNEMRDEMRDRRNNLQMCRIGKWRAGSVPQWKVAEDQGQSWGEFIGKD